MSENLVKVFSKFEKEDDDGNKFWLARDLSKLLEYNDYRNFLKVIDKAKIACENSGYATLDHFVDFAEMVAIGSGAKRETDNIILSRYACYLIAQNGDSRKTPIALAQSYFALQTRKQELREKELADEETRKRLDLRDQLKEHNKSLASVAKDSGVVSPQDFAIFQSKGYQGLYNKTVPQIKSYKGLAEKDNLLDRMGSTELAANYFRVTQTEQKLINDGIKGKEKAGLVHFNVGKKVRQAMLDISGTPPEELSLAEPLKKAQKRLDK